MLRTAVGVAALLASASFARAGVDLGRVLPIGDSLTLGYMFYDPDGHGNDPGGYQTAFYQTGHNGFPGYLLREMPATDGSADLDKLLGDLYADRPNARVYVSQLLPDSADPSVTAQVRQ